MPYSPPTLNQAIAHHRTGDFERAELKYRDVIAREPGCAEAVYYLGAVLLARGRMGEAIEEFRRAIELQPGYVEALNNLDVALARAERFDEAVVTLRQALTIRPDWNELLSNLGGILRAQGRLDEAADCYRRIVDLDPSVPESHNLYGTVLAVAGRLKESVAHFKEALRLRPAYATAHGNLLMARGHDPSVDPSTLFAEHRFFDLLHGPGMSPAPAHQNDRTPDRRLRIGYVSADFRSHALSNLAKATA